MDGYDQMAEMLKSLGHPYRLQIMEILGEEGEACVCHLEHVLGLRQAYISQQLARLREAGLVEDRKEGLNVFYSVRGEKSTSCLACLKEWAVDVCKDGERLRFERRWKKPRISCPCPICKEKRPSAPTFLTAIKEKIIGKGR